MSRRTVLLAAMAVLLFGLTCVYRFETMGGRLGGFDNDEFVVMSYAQQMVLGDHPTRDYIEPGRPLQHLMLAAAQSVLGPTLFSQFAMSVAMIALSTALLFLLAERASGSIPVALAIALTQIAMAPRYYNFPKVLAYAVGIPAIWWYIDRPGRTRLLLLAAAGAFAFLLRHDHGAYVALGGVVAILTTRWPDVRKGLTDVALVGLMALALVAPYVIYTQVYQNVFSYVKASIEFGERSTDQTELQAFPRFAFDASQPLWSTDPPAPEAAPRINVRWAPGTDEATRARREQALGLVPDNVVAADTWNYKVEDWSRARLETIVSDPLVAATEGIDRSTMAVERSVVSRRGRVLAAIDATHILPGFITEQNAIAFLYYLVALPPLVALGLIVARSKVVTARPWNRAAAKMAAVSVLGVAMTAGLLRANVGARLADVSEVAGVIVAWLGGLLLARGSRAGRLAAVTLAVTVFLVSAISVQALEHLAHQFTQIGFEKGRGGMRQHAAAVYRTLTAVPPVAAWDRREPGIVELASYVNSCTVPDDRLTVLGYLSEIFFLSHRAFTAGSAWILPGYFMSEADQRLMIARMESHRVPIALAVPEPEYSEDYVPAFPLLVQYIQREYREVGMTTSDPRYHFRVLVRRSLSPLRNDPVLGFPCFAAAGQ